MGRVIPPSDEAAVRTSDEADLGDPPSSEAPEASIDEPALPASPDSPESTSDDAAPVEPPPAPLIFGKWPSSVIGPGEEIRWDPAFTTQVDYEAELAVVIGRTARRVDPADALGHVLGYTCLNDVTARDLQFEDGQWTRGKSLDTFCPMGPELVTRDEIADPQTLEIECRVGDRVLQHSNTSQMYFGVAEIVSHCSQAFTLEPGDVIATGTPGGVGIFRDPPVLLDDGDVVTVEIEGIGSLVNRCRHEHARVAV